jgi:hypothetical protein
MPRLQSAIIELEGAATAMPVSHERVLLHRALEMSARCFRECARSLEVRGAPGSPRSGARLIERSSAVRSAGTVGGSRRARNSAGRDDPADS